MAYDENIYARIITGDLSHQEIEMLKKSGEWEEINRIIEAADNLTLPQFDKKAAYDSLISNKQLGHKNKLGSRSIIYYLSAASVMILLGTIFLLKLGAGNHFEADYTENKLIDLPDESIVNLNDGSSIEFSARKWHDRRRLILKGEASFKVEKGSDFSVTTKNGDVRVLGTYFNVRAWDDNLYVECYEGKVQVTKNDSSLILLAGMSINIEEDFSVKVEGIGHSNPQWTEGNSRFYEESVRSVFDEMERQYDISIEYEKLDQYFSGTFRHNNLSEALEKVCRPLGLQYSIEKNRKRIVIH